MLLQQLRLRLRRRLLRRAEDLAAARALGHLARGGPAAAHSKLRAREAVAAADGGAALIALALALALALLDALARRCRCRCRGGRRARQSGQRAGRLRALPLP